MKYICHATGEDVELEPIEDTVKTGNPFAFLAGDTCGWCGEKVDAATTIDGKLVCTLCETAAADKHAEDTEAFINWMVESLELGAFGSPEWVF